MIAPPDNLHPTHIDAQAAEIPGESLGAQVLGLRYDLALRVLRGMLAEAERQQYADLARGRHKLSEALGQVRAGLQQAVEGMERAVGVCAPHIETEKCQQAPTATSNLQEEGLSWIGASWAESQRRAEQDYAAWQPKA